MYNVRLRRDQIRVVEMYVATTRFTARQQEELGSLTAAGLVAHALASGEVDRVRELLRRKGWITPLTVAFKTMQNIQRNVRGSDSEKDWPLLIFCSPSLVWMLVLTFHSQSV